MSKHKYHCLHCSFKTNNVDEYTEHAQTCAKEKEEKEQDILGDYYWKLDMLRDDARVPSELIDLLYDMALELRSK